MKKKRCCIGIWLLEGSMSCGTLMAVNQLQATFANLSGILPKYVEMCAATGV